MIKKFKESFNFIKSSKRYIYFILGLFFVSFLLAFFLPTPVFLEGFFKSIIQKLVEETQNFNTGEFIGYILLNNLRASFIGLFLGLIFGIVPLTFCLINGYLVGFVSRLTVNQGSIIELWRLLPHGIFELPVIFISLGIGLRLGISIFSLDDKSILKVIKSAFWSFILIVIPLLVLAAIIEGVLIGFFN